MIAAVVFVLMFAVALWRGPDFTWGMAFGLAVPFVWHFAHRSM